MADKTSLETLLDDLKDIHPITRKQAIQSLAEMGDKSIIPTLIELLKNDESPLVRQTIIQAFQKGLTDRACTGVLIETLSDNDSTVRGASAAALGIIKDRSAIAYLCKALKDESDHVRWAAIYSLGKICDKSAIGELNALISNAEETPNIRDAAKEALRQIRIS